MLVRGVRIGGGRACENGPEGVVQGYGWPHARMPQRQHELLQALLRVARPRLEQLRHRRRRLKLACHHRDFKAHCGKCPDDRTNCVRQDPRQRVVCFHKNFTEAVFGKLMAPPQPSTHAFSGTSFGARSIQAMSDSDSSGPLQLRQRGVAGGVLR